MLLLLALRSLPLSMPAVQAAEPEVRPATWFVEDAGQWPESVLFLGRFSGVDVRLERDAAWFQALEVEEPEARSGAFTDRRPDSHLHRSESESTGRLHAVAMRFPGAGLPEVRGEQVSTGAWNYLRGAQDEWVTVAGGFEQVRLDELWPGIDLVLLEDDEGRPRFDFELEPGADPASIGRSFDGAGIPELRAGQVQLASDSASWFLPGPRSVQVDAGETRVLSSRWVLQPDATLGFDLDEHDARLPLVIDPSVVFSSYLGGIGHDAVGGVYAVGDDTVILTGVSYTENLPVLPGGYDVDFKVNGEDLFATRISGNGWTPVYSTYLTGPYLTAGLSYIYSTLADECVYVAYTTLNMENVTPGAYVSPGADEYSIRVAVSKLNKTGTGLDYSAPPGYGRANCRLWHTG